MSSMSEKENDCNHTGVEKAPGGASFVPGGKDDPHRGYRIGKQCVLALSYIGLGFFNEIIGPTLPDLKDRIGVNYEVVSRALVAKSIGSMSGAVIGGFIHERFYHHKELIVALSLWLGALSTAVIPHGRWLPLVGTFFAFSGMAEGLIDSGGNILVMDLWGERAAGPMHSIHFGFGAGALLAPQLARPFLSPDARDQSEDPLSTEVPTTLSWNTTTAEPPVSRIEIAYGIVAGMVFVIGLCLLILYCIGPPKDFQIREKLSPDWKVMLQPASCGHGHAFYAVELLILLFFYFIQVVGGERAMGQFLFSFAVESDVDFTKKDATSLQTAFWGCFTAGRLLGIPLGRFIPIWIFMSFDAAGVVVIAVIMSIYGYKNRLILWVTSSLMGFFISMQFPNGMSWANLYLRMNSVGVMFMILGGACGGLIYQYLTGFLFEQDPRNLPYVMVGAGGGLVIVYVIMQILAEVHKKIVHKRTNESHTDLVIVVDTKEKLAIDNVAFDTRL